MAFTTTNLFSEKLPSQKELEKKSFREQVPPDDMFWECPRCHACVLYLLENCPHEGCKSKKDS